MRVVALVSGGKDSCYNMIECVREGHAIVALANLHPPQGANDELDSYMYQTVGHDAIGLYAEAMGLPLYRAAIRGSARLSEMEYRPTEGDEVEDLHRLLARVKEDVEFEAVSVGAILSNYQRVRVENVCRRLGLTSLSYLWRREQSELLSEMIACGIHAVLVKVAALGLLPEKHLGLSLSEIQPHMERSSEKYGLNVCGEGGEYETFTLDCPLFKKRIVVDEKEVLTHSEDQFAPVAYLNFTRTHLEDKQLGDLTQAQLIADLPVFHDRPELADAPVHAVNGTAEPPAATNGATVPPEPADVATVPPEPADVAAVPLEPADVAAVPPEPADVATVPPEPADVAAVPPEPADGATVPPEPADVATEPPEPADVGTEPPEPANVATVPPEPTVAESAGWLWIGPIEGAAEGDRSGMEVAMDRLTALLAAHHLPPSSLTSVSLFISHMSLYPSINATYRRRLGGCRPARLCVQAPLPAEVRLEVTAVREGAAHGREMHVESVSRWAPANIGPYSQSVLCGDVLYVAGMIGLDAARMRLVRGGESQARLALRHVSRVIEASASGADMDTVVQTVCYVTDPSLLAPCSALMTSQLTNSLHCAVVVPGLPRGAAVEWHVWAHTRNEQFQSRQSSLHLDGAAMEVSLRWSPVHKTAAATVLCSAETTAPSTETAASSIETAAPPIETAAPPTETAGPSAGQLTACLRSTVGCLRARAGAGAVCQLRVFHSVEDWAAVAAAALSIRGPGCVVTPVPVTAVGGQGSRRVAVTALAVDAAREKRD